MDKLDTNNMNTCPECFEQLDGFGQCLQCGIRVHLGSDSQQNVEAADQESQKQNRCVHCGADATFVMSVADAEQKLANVESPPKTFVRPDLIRTGSRAGWLHIPVSAVAGFGALSAVSRGDTGSVIFGLLAGWFAVWVAMSGSKQNTEYEVNVRQKSSAAVFVLEKMEELQLLPICIMCEKLQSPSGETQYEFWKRNAASQPGIMRLESGELNTYPFRLYRNFAGTWREWYEQSVIEV